MRVDSLNIYCVVFNVLAEQLELINFQVRDSGIGLISRGRLEAEPP